jgi:copper chaperone CopZ
MVATLGIGVVAAAGPSHAKIVFFVRWYDVGKAALEGLQGVQRVTTGFRGSSEIDTVLYDPGVIHPQEMVSALKKAGTYLGIAEQ